MQNWKKTSLLTTALLLLLLTGLFYIFNVHLSRTSADIDFSPTQPGNETLLKDHNNKPENIILFIADGMGFGHLSMALHTQQIAEIPSVWQAFEIKGWHDTRSAYGSLTDSEASATAIATGVSTNFGHIGIDTEGNRLKNLFETAAEGNRNTAIVTDSYIWDATPAAFTVHTRNEDDARDILNQIAASSLDLLFGELEDVGEEEVPEEKETIAILEQRFYLLDRTLNLPAETTIPVAAVFKEDEVQDMESSPNLLQLTEVALQYLTARDESFILLVESEEMDAASHENDTERILKGLRSIQNTLNVLLQFSKLNGKTLLLFTSDHETGGLAAVSDFSNYPKMQLRWATKGHTAAVVPLFADGPGAERFLEIHRNREIGQLLNQLISRDSTTLLDGEEPPPVIEL